MFISFAILAFAAFKLNYGWVAILSLLLLSYAGVNLAVFFKDRPNLIIYLLSLIMLLLFIFSAVILKNGGFWRFGCYFARLCSPLCWALRAPKRLRIFHLYFMPRSRLWSFQNLSFLSNTRRKDVDYKFLLTGKSALKVLASSLCEVKDKEQMPCEIDEKAVKIYGIKLLCNIGKFYYLQAKDGVKFELDSSKIISRVKEERD